MGFKNTIIDIDTIEYKKLFSICTLVTDYKEYELLINSAYEAGFNEKNSEFLYVNNTEKNSYDAYSGLNQLLNKALGKYVILVHQDVEFRFDSIEDLRRQIELMDKTDPSWAILGNTGYDYNNINRQYTRITDPGQKDYKEGPFPIKVSCVDENIMIVKNDLNLFLSTNIGHFHLYGADLSINAEVNGYSTYVIDFHILHKSGGFPNKSFFDTKERFIKQYQKVLSIKFFRTPCTILFLSNSKILNKLMNTKVVYSLKKRYDFIIELFLAKGKR